MSDFSFDGSVNVLEFKTLKELQGELEVPGHKHTCVVDACENVSKLSTLQEVQESLESKLDSCETKADLTVVQKASAEDKSQVKHLFATVRSTCNAVAKQVASAGKRARAHASAKAKEVAKRAAAEPSPDAAQPPAAEPGKVADGQLPPLFDVGLTDEFAMPRVQLTTSELAPAAVLEEIQKAGIDQGRPYVVQAACLQGLMEGPEAKVKLGAFHAEFLTSEEWRSPHGRGAKAESLPKTLELLRPLFHPGALNIDESVVKSTEPKAIPELSAEHKRSV